MVDEFIFSFILTKLKFSFYVFLLLIILVFVLGNKIFLSYTLGYLIGVANFIVLSLSTNYIIKKEIKYPKLTQFLFFTLRIFVVSLILAEAVSKGHNVFTLFLGFMVLNISIKLSAYLECRREG